MKILCVISRYDYGDSARGNSFEYDYFFETLLKMGHQPEVFDYQGQIAEFGKDAMGQNLINKVEELKPDIVFTVLMNDEIPHATFEWLKSNHGKSIIWMCDDKWRFEIFGYKFANLFNYIITTDPEAISKYNKLGQNQVILSQWGSKDFDFPSDNYKYDVSFVGQSNRVRKYFIERLRANGIKVDCFGYGWENGRLNQNEMFELFKTSKINLNLSNSTFWDLEYFLRNPLNLAHTLLSKKNKEDIKARFFEVTGAGGFLLSYNVNYLENYFELDKEIVTFSGVNDLIKKIKFYLKNDQIREEIKLKGYNRTNHQHLIQKRFEDIFKVVLA